MRYAPESFWKSFVRSRHCVKESQKPDHKNRILAFLLALLYEVSWDWFSKFSK